jgi:hypothetical protein
MHKNFGFRNKDFTNVGFENSTLMWSGTDLIKNYIKKNNSYDKNSFEYKFNSHGYRCDEFTDIGKSPIRILFLGCSHTEGIGLPIEHTWAKLLLKEFEEAFKVKIPFWNLALGGKSLDYCARIAWKAIPQLKPHFVFILNPSFGRREVVIDNEIADYLVQDPECVIDFESMEFGLSDDNELYNVCKNISFINEICKVNNTKLFWNSSMQIQDWGKPNPLNEYLDEDILSKQWQTLFYRYDLARDSQHYGFDSHQRFAHSTFQELIGNMSL